MSIQYTVPGFEPTTTRLGLLRLSQQNAGLQHAVTTIGSNQAKGKL